MPGPTMPAIRGVVFDVHSTLLHGGEPVRWLETAWEALGRPARARDALGAELLGEAAAFLDRIWEHARALDPHSGRDLSPRRHREVFDATIQRAPGVDSELADALYAAMAQQWQAYDDVVPVLTALREQGTRLVALSNVGFDLAPTLARTGLGALLDGLLMSYELGVVKPDPAIFTAALGLLGLPAAEVLMVGDSWLDDGGAAALGIRTLLLPRTDGPEHGLAAVLRLAAG